MPQRTSKKRKMLLIIADIRRVQEGSILSYSFQWTSDCGGHCPICVRPSEPVTPEKYPSLCMKEVSLWALTPPPLSALYNPFLDSGVGFFSLWRFTYTQVSNSANRKEKNWDWKPSDHRWILQRAGRRWVLKFI